MFGVDVSIVGERRVSMEEEGGDDTEQLRPYPLLGAVPWIE